MKLRLIILSIAGTLLAVGLGWFGYNKYVQSTTDKNVRRELVRVEAILRLNETNIKSVSTDRYEGFNGNLLYPGNISRQARTIGYYNLEGLSLEQWLQYRDSLLDQYSQNETIRTGCSDDTTKLSTCERTVSRQEGEEILRRDWTIATRPHKSCYKGLMIEQRQIIACLKVNPNEPYQYSEFTKERKYPEHNVIVEIFEEDPIQR